MKRPIKPYKPDIRDYEARIGKIKTLQSYIFVDPECSERYEEQISDYGTVIPDYKPWLYETKVASLQELIDLSKGQDPKNVNIILYRDRDLYSISVDLTSKETYSSEEVMSDYKSDLDNYEDSLNNYHAQLKEYDNWCNQKEIERLEARIIALKKK